ncbi:uroporphyrinogen-III C-methyltransferase [Orbaceae bacterium ac157xtp]
MTANNSQLYSRCMSANATLSNISTIEPTAIKKQVIKTLNSNYTKEIKNPISKDPETSNKVKNSMKEANIVNTPPIETKETQPKQPRIESKKAKTPISKLSIIAILLTACLGGGGFYYIQQQNQTIDKLNNELTSLKTTLEQEVTQSVKYDVVNFVNKQNAQLELLDDKVNTTLKEQVELQKSLSAKVNDSLKVAETNIVNLNERLTAISKSDNNTWLISQANYLVNLAARKIWSDQDYVTARLLLKNADSSLAQTNDPSLLPARQAIMNDINQLAKISYIDYDGIVMNLFGLADTVSELPLVDHFTDIELNKAQSTDSIADTAPKTESTSDSFTMPTSMDDVDSLTDSISDWSSNITKSSKSFLEKFIQIERYDTFGECIANAGKNIEQIEKCQIHKALITPEQAIYLRENIRLRLFIAAQAVPRYQENIYKRALNDVSIWVNAYFDKNSPSVKAFLDDLNKLSQQTIHNDSVPERLSSQSELDALMQTRVRSMLAN